MTCISDSNAGLPSLHNIISSKRLHLCHLSYPRQAPAQSQVNKDEEDEFAAELLSDDDDDSEDLLTWTCSCGSVSRREMECCSNCALPQPPTTWTCGSCHTQNKLSTSSCNECFTDRDSSPPDDAEEPKRVVDVTKIKSHSMFYYLISIYTHRVFLHDEVRVRLILHAQHMSILAKHFHARTVFTVVEMLRPYYS